MLIKVIKPLRGPLGLWAEGAGLCRQEEAGPASHVSDTLAGKHDFPAWLWPGHSWAEPQVLAMLEMVRNFLRKAVPELKPDQNQVF